MSEDFPRERLSLCMIVRNEAEKLGRCLISAAPWVGEMIVVDTGSTDDTVAIAESFGAKVVHFQWCDDFAAARNAGLEHATCHWVLVLDADEELVVELPDMLADLLRREIPHRLHLRIQNKHETGSGTWAPILRLFTREQPGARFRSRIHEHLPIIPGVSVEQGIVEGVWVRHDGYTQKVASERDKVARNVALSRLQVADAPEDPHAWWCLATSLPPSDCAEAVECFEKALKMLDGETENGGPLLASIYVMGASAMQNAGLKARALEFLNQGLERFPNFPDLLLQRGTVLLKDEQFERAQQDFLAVRRERAGQFYLRLIEPVSALVASRVGRGHALARLGRIAEAEAEWLAALPLVTPQTASPYLPLAHLQMERGMWRAALDYLEREAERADAASEVTTLMIRCLLELGQLERAWDLLGEVPESPAVLGYRAQILLMRGCSDEALEILEQAWAPDAMSWEKSWAYLCVGDISRTLTVWRSAHRGNPDGTEAGLLPLLLHLFADDPLSDAYTLEMPALIELVRGVRYLIRCHRFDELAIVIEKGRRLPPATWKLLRANLGKQLAFDGFADVALELLVEALRDDPKQPEILYWAGFAALQLTYVEDARTFWEACVGLDPEYTLARQGLDMLPNPPVPLVS